MSFLFFNQTKISVRLIIFYILSLHRVKMIKIILKISWTGIEMEGILQGIMEGNGIEKNKNPLFFPFFFLFLIFYRYITSAFPHLIRTQRVCGYGKAFPSLVVFFFFYNPQTLLFPKHHSTIATHLPPSPTAPLRSRNLSAPFSAPANQPFFFFFFFFTTLVGPHLLEMALRTRRGLRQVPGEARTRPRRPRPCRSPRHPSKRGCFGGAQEVLDQPRCCRCFGNRGRVSRVEALGLCGSVLDS